MIGTVVPFASAEFGFIHRVTLVGPRRSSAYSIICMVTGPEGLRSLLMDKLSNPLPLRALKWRCTHWWRMQQSLPSSIGLRHPCRFYASNPERQLSDLVIVMAVIGLCLRLIGQGGPQLVSPTLLHGTFVGALDVNFRSDTSWLFFPYDEVTVEHCD